MSGCLGRKSARRVSPVGAPAAAAVTAAVAAASASEPLFGGDLEEAVRRGDVAAVSASLANGVPDGLLHAAAEEGQADVISVLRAHHTTLTASREKMRPGMI